MIEAIAPGLWSIDGGAVRVYLLHTDDTLTLIDTGMPGWRTRILKAIRETGHDPTHIDQIILTHGDIDHAGNAAALQKELNVPIIAHEAERPILLGIPRPFGSPPLIQKLLSRLSARSGYTSVSPDRTVSDGEPLPGGLQVIHTPGHTPGSISIYHPELRWLFVGDAIRHRRKRLTLPPSTILPDPQQAYASAHRLAKLPAEICCFGHGPPIVGNAQAALSQWAQTLPR